MARQNFHYDPYFNIDDNRFQTVDYTNLPVPMLAWDLYQPAGYRGGSPAHWHNEIEINFYLEGDGYYYVNGRQFRISGGQAIFLKPDVLHSSRASGNALTARIFLINPQLLGGANSRLLETFFQKLDRLPDAILIDGTSSWHREFFSYITRLFEDYQGKKEGYERFCAAEIYWILGLIERCNTDSYALSPDHTAGKASLEYLKQMISFIQQHYAEKIYIDDIAASASISKSFCDKLFRRILQCSPTEYLLDCRIQESKHLLRNGAGVTETAMACGFNNLSYFSRQFKNRTGISPAQFRKEG